VSGEARAGGGGGAASNERGREGKKWRDGVIKRAVSEARTATRQRPRRYSYGLLRFQGGRRDRAAYAILARRRYKGTAEPSKSRFATGPFAGRIKDAIKSPDETRAGRLGSNVAASPYEI